MTEGVPLAALRRRFGSLGRFAMRAYELQQRHQTIGVVEKAIDANAVSRAKEVTSSRAAPISAANSIARLSLGSLWMKSRLNTFQGISLCCGFVRKMEN
jgi:hypothetical protein